ncbi:mCG147726 [Mus musculus]|nr:mCG147726 [Mus musculus]
MLAPLGISRNARLAQLPRHPEFNSQQRSQPSAMRLNGFFWCV